MTSGGWKTEIQANGRAVITSPTTGNFARAYTDPLANRRPHSRGPGHGHGHEHGARRSWLTNRILLLTTGLPVLHAIMAEKDSRRIAYYIA